MDKFNVRFLSFDSKKAVIVEIDDLYKILTTYRGRLSFNTKNVFDSHNSLNTSVLILGVIQRNYNG